MFRQSTYSNPQRRAQHSINTSDQKVINSCLPLPLPLLLLLLLLRSKIRNHWIYERIRSRNTKHTSNFRKFYRNSRRRHWCVCVCSLGFATISALRDHETTVTAATTKRTANRRRRKSWETPNGWTHSIVKFIVFHFYGHKTRNLNFGEFEEVEETHRIAITSVH